MNKLNEKEKGTSLSGKQVGSRIRRQRFNEGMVPIKILKRQARILGLEGVVFEIGGEGVDGGGEVLRRRIHGSEGRKTTRTRLEIEGRGGVKREIQRATKGRE